MNFRARSGGGHFRRPEKVWRVVRSAGYLAVCGVLVSCQTTPVQTSVFRRDFRPDNVFVYPSRLSLDFRRVAVLPIAPASASGDLPAGSEALAPVLLEQIAKTKSSRPWP